MKAAVTGAALVLIQALVPAPAAADPVAFQAPYPAGAGYTWSSCGQAGDCSAAAAGDGTLTVQAVASGLDTSSEAVAGIKVSGLEAPGVGRLRLFAKLDISALQTVAYPRGRVLIHLVVEQPQYAWSIYPTASCTSQTGLCEIEISLDGLDGPGAFDLGVEAHAYASHLTGYCLSDCPSASATVRIVEFGVR